MRVEDLMSKQVHWCRPEDSMDRAAQLMWDHDVGVIPVCTSDGATRLVGIITDRDIAMCALFRGKALHEIVVSEGMTRDPRVARPQDSPSEAEQTMRQARVRRLPVVGENDALLGIVSLADLGREASREPAGRERDVSTGEVADTLAAIVSPSPGSGPEARH
jgi:CBS domain-containing protein